MFDAAGAPVDPYNLNSYVLSTATGTSSRTEDVKRSAYANLARSFDLRGNPLTLKGGLDKVEGAHIAASLAAFEARQDSLPAPETDGAQDVVMHAHRSSAGSGVPNAALQHEQARTVSAENKGWN